MEKDYRFKVNLGGMIELFYQISMEDSRRFFEDYRKRSAAMGYNERVYYNYLSEFYWPIDQQYAAECFDRRQRLPRNPNSDCEACEQNQAIEFYLRQGKPDQAKALAGDIESFRLTCHGEPGRAWEELQSVYLNHHLRKKEFEQAKPYCRRLERSGPGESQDGRRAAILYAYAHWDIGKALSLFKRQWRQWQEWRCPWDAFYMNLYICGFFSRLMEQGGSSTVKIDFDPSFPLYGREQQYETEALFQYYYGRARELAEKFDNRNGTDYYKKEQEHAITSR